MKLFRLSRNGKAAYADVVSDVPAEELSGANSDDAVSDEISIDASPSERDNAQSYGEESVSIDLDLDTDLSGEEKGYTIERYVAQILPEDVVRRLNLLPVKIENDELQMITVEPLNLPSMDQVKLMTGLKVKPIIVPEKELSRAINEQFSSGQASKQAIIDMMFHDEVDVAQRADEVTPAGLEEAPVVELVRNIIHEAIKDKASDIHLEPQYTEMQVRYRINGLLHDITVVPHNIKASVVARIKLLADMDITEARRSQDGHMGVNYNGRRIDLRVSTVLTANGEKVVMRILDKESMSINMGHLGMTDEQQTMFRSFITQPYGMILVTGPTGQGKSTSLYAALQELDSITQNIVTIENPVEYQMPRINQISVNPYIGMTFATALRTIVRQDPDIIMVGEIRDGETADIAINAALTGHLVFSTLHTNDAPSALVRLLDMGIEPFLTSSAVIGIVAQRLVRTICPECKEFYRPSQDEIKLLDLPDDSIELAVGKGCDVCHDTGYTGRIGIFEIFEIDEDVRKLILAKVPSSEIKALALTKGMKSLSEMGRDKVLQGISTTEEVRRVIYTGKD